MTAKASNPISIWDKQKMYGGERLEQVYQSGDAFILRGFEYVGEIELPESGDEVEKTNLITNTLTDPQGEKIIVGTLSRPIASMAKDDLENNNASDFPAVVYWTKVETKRGLNPATVLRLVEPYTGD